MPNNSIWSLQYKFFKRIFYRSRSLFICWVDLCFTHSLLSHFLIEMQQKRLFEVFPLVSFVVSIVITTFLESQNTIGIQLLLVLLRAG